MSDLATNDEILGTFFSQNIQEAGDKSTETIEADRRIVAIIHELKNAAARLRATSAALVTSYKNLLEANERIESLVAELARANEKLLKTSEQIAKNQRMEKEFISIAAHELRTPLTPIIATMYLAKPQDDDGISDITLTRQGHEIVVRNAKSLEMLSNNILDVVRIDGGKLTLQREVFDITKMIEKVIKETMNTVPSSRTTQIHLARAAEGQGPGAPILLSADTLKVVEVLANLLRNAMRFSQNGTIGISAQRDGDNIVIKVGDDGKGIDPEVMPKLFQKFATSSEMGGTGLGLFISRAIVEAHGGKIWGANNPDGRGATFAFTPPVGEAQVNFESILPWTLIVLPSSSFS